MTAYVPHIASYCCCVARLGVVLVSAAIYLHSKYPYREVSPASPVAGAAPGKSAVKRD
jgi:hypothetical protein